MFSYFPAAVRLLVFVLWTLLLIGPYTLIMLARLKYRPLARLYWASVGRIIGIKVRVHGQMTDRAPLMVVANHSSYLDIVTLGGCVPGVFIAKAEVNGWPGINLIGKAGRTIFVNRQRSATGQARDEIRSRFEEGNPLILFPEGTSNDGNRVYPFKSALFAVAAEPVVLPGNDEASPVWVQPVSIAYTEVDGFPMRYFFRPLYAWYGDMELAPHLWRVLAFGRGTADIIFHDPVLADSFSSRKALSTHCYDVVSAGVVQALRGRAGTGQGATTGAVPAEA